MAASASAVTDRQPLLGSDQRDTEYAASAPTRKTRRRLCSPNTARNAAVTLVSGLFIAIIIIVIALAIKQEVDEKRGRPQKKPPLPPIFNLPPPKPGLRNPSRLVRSKYGVVATETENCSNVGVQVLKDGGTATDAAIAAALCVGTENLFASGIGGGGFMIIRPPTSEACSSKRRNPSDKGAESACKPTLAIDFRETAPAAASPDMFVGSPLASQIGGLAAGVPGEIRGFWEAWSRYGGGVSWKKLFEPSIKLANENRVTKELKRRLEYFGGFMPGKEAWESLFLPDGEWVEVGDIFRRPAYANTLRRISEDGPDAFYKGSIAESLVETIKETGGVMTLEDFASYKANVTEAVQGSYLNRTIHTTHLPTAGPVLLSLLNTLENYDLVSEGRTPLNVHRFVEALKYAFAHRTHLGDPAFEDVEDYRRRLLTKEFGRATFLNITDDRTHNVSYYNPVYASKEDHGTTHISVLDARGGAAAITSTVNLIFGSQVLDAETGVVLNDEMDDFSTPGMPNAFGLWPSRYNFPQPGKRPLSSIAPVIVEDETTGEPIMVMGGSGGSLIFGSIAQVLLNIDWGYDASNAVEKPRVHSQLLPAEVFVESGFREETIKALEELGHNTTWFDVNLGASEVQVAVKKGDGWIYGASDSRKHGVAAAWL